MYSKVIKSGTNRKLVYDFLLVFFGWWWLSVVVSTLALFNEVNRHWARLVLGWVTVYGQVNHLGIWPAT